MRTRTDLKKLAQEAVRAAEAHRNAMRLLAQGVDDMQRMSPKSLRDFFTSTAGCTSLLEAHMLTDASMSFQAEVHGMAVQALEGSEYATPAGRKKYEDLIEEARERVRSTCPCRGCVKARVLAKKAVSDCFRKIQKQKTQKEPK